MRNALTTRTGRIAGTLAGLAVVSVPVGSVLAEEVSITVEIPRLDVAEYHRPYVAMWVEQPDYSVAAPLAVWYDTDLPKNEGATWLKDMRQYWRRVGRSLDMPADGISGPTQAPGTHEIRFAGAQSPFQNLSAGSYRLVVEAAREVGGRELLRIPFEVPEGDATLTAEGESELGRVTLEFTP